MSDPCIVKVLVPLSGVSRPTTMDYHVTSKYLYYSDSLALKIQRVKLFEDQAAPEGVVNEGVNKVEGLAIDWIGGNLYWTDEGLQTIFLTSLERPGPRLSLVTRNTSNVRSLAVGPAAGLMFWSVWNNVGGESVQSGGILGSWMDGSNIRSLVTTGLQWPNGLVFDAGSSTLYWCDTFLNKAGFLYLAGEKEKSIYCLVKKCNRSRSGR